MINQIKAHFIDAETGRMIWQQLVPAVPRVGDELRFKGEGGPRYFKVTVVVFVYDEEAHRVNIGCELITDAEPQ